MKKSPTLFLSILFLSFFPIKNLYAQTTQKDSLSKYSFEELSEKFYAAKPDSLKAVLYAKYYIDKAKRAKDTLQAAEGNYYLSDITKDSIYFVNYWNEIIKSTRITKNNVYPAYSYLEKGDFFFHKGEKDKALNNYLLTQKAIKLNKNDSLKNINLTRLGMTKIRNGEIKSALILFKESYNYYNSENINKKNANDYFSLLINLSLVYNHLKVYDSALLYNKKANLLALRYNKNAHLGFTRNNRGMLLYRKKKFTEAIESLKKSINFIIRDENYSILSATYYLLAGSYLELSDKRNTFKYFYKVDSLFSVTNNYYISQKPAYKFLANYYKEKKDDKKQLEYINKYIKVDSVLNARSKNIARSLNDNYDIPNLLEEKELIEKKLQQEVSTTYKWSLRITSLAVVLLLFLIQQSNKRKRYKKRFQQLIANSNQKTIKNKTTVVKKEQTVSDAVLESITEHLALFEKNKEFLSTEITLSYLAKTFETNSKYLSQVINQQKEQSFNNYINSLRIKYTIEKLKTDLVFRKYSIKAIANEVGFNTTESFSKAFFKNTGIRPSFFIKELEKK